MQVSWKTAIMLTRIIQCFHQRLQHELSCFIWSVKCQRANCTTCFSNLEQPQQTLPDARQAHGGHGRELPLHLRHIKSRKGRHWRPEWENHRYCHEVKEYKTTIQEGQASLVLLLTKDLVKSMKSKDWLPNLKKHCKMLVWCFFKGSLYFLTTFIEYVLIFTT